ncbi:amidohydrolase family protein [Aliikangiella coralliicola]|uniref:Amidohydrolase family protein n=1 Tax=Aliikangiella coralliicola TaxID=2592383 RepID=A0A545UJT8_9GAMM|nr:amidohydrolase family protein [Aliikangiella coralliicola]TQV89720.1 amidohydrolase family protein [Aliikangiella coralliicola]
MIRKRITKSNHKNPRRRAKAIYGVLLALAGFSLPAFQVSSAPLDAPERVEGEGPFERLILRGGILINGEGAPPRGPVDIVIEDNRIVQIKSVGNPGVPIVAKRPEATANDKVIDVEGHYILPGFVDMHAHIGGSHQITQAEYTFKLWLAHGITTIREPGSFNGDEFVLSHMKKSQKNSIAAPRIVPYFWFGLGNKKGINTPSEAKSWVKKIAKQGARGIKFFGTKPEIFKAAVDEAKKRGLKTMMHHAQLDVVHLNAVDSARMGLNTMEHWYGLPEAMFTDQVIQNYPLDYNYNNEQHRFGEAGKLWLQAAEPGSPKWNAVRDELIELDLTINPTMTIYDASRDLMRERNADWHTEYTLPGLWEFFQASRYAHGSYWFDWTTQDEINWKKNYQRWMTFLNDYKNHGGRVTTGSDSGYIYKIYGFGFIRELELLQEAGFHPLEVIKSATINGAEALGMSSQIGSVAVGKLADLVIVEENPLRNFKTLYGTGHIKLDESNKPVTVGGVKYTIKDGIIYDAKKLLDDVKQIVKQEKEKANNG